MPGECGWVKAEVRGSVRRLLLLLLTAMGFWTRVAEWMDLGCVCELELAGLADRLEVGSKRR